MAKAVRNDCRNERVRDRPPAPVRRPARVTAAVAWTSREVNSVSTASRSGSKPTTVQKPNSLLQIARHRLARPTGVCDLSGSVAASIARSMLCRAIRSCAPAVNASASASEVVASALASSARIRLSTRSSTGGPGRACAAVGGLAVPGIGPSLSICGSEDSRQSSSNAREATVGQSLFGRSHQARRKV